MRLSFPLGLFFYCTSGLGGGRRGLSAADGQRQALQLSLRCTCEKGNGGSWEWVMGSYVEWVMGMVGQREV